MISPGDPSEWQKVGWTTDGATGQREYMNGFPTTYNFNLPAFVGPPVFPASIRDGTAATIALCERYCVRYYDPDQYDPAMPTANSSYFTYSQLDVAYPSPYLPFPLQINQDRRPSFADPGGTTCWW